jgi:hypothetical protein
MLALFFLIKNREERGMNKYQDIIDLPHHVSKTHPQMSRKDRAAQFSPFAALTGHGEAILETGRLTDRKIELEEEEKVRLDRYLQYLRNHIQEHPVVEITYFLPDRKKEGGAYIDVVGAVKKIDTSTRQLILMDQTCIPMEDIFQIQIQEEL